MIVLWPEEKLEKHEDLETGRDSTLKDLSDAVHSLFPEEASTLNGLAAWTIWER